MSEYIKPIDMPRISNSLQTVERLLEKAFPDSTDTRFKLELEIHPNRGLGRVRYHVSQSVENRGIHHGAHSEQPGHDPDAMIADMITGQMKRIESLNSTSHTITPSSLAVPKKRKAKRKSRRTPKRKERR